MSFRNNSVPSNRARSSASLQRLAFRKVFASKTAEQTSVWKKLIRSDSFRARFARILPFRKAPVRWGLIALSLAALTIPSIAQDQFTAGYGTGSLDWNVGTNWSLGEPTLSTDVLIQGFVYPIYISAGNSAFCDDMQLWSTGLTNYGSLTVAGNLDYENFGNQNSGYALATSGYQAVTTIGNANATITVDTGSFEFPGAFTSIDGGTTNVTANTFSFGGGGGEAYHNYDSSFGAFGTSSVNGQASTFSVTANQIMIDGGYAEDGGSVILNGGDFNLVAMRTGNGGILTLNNTGAITGSLLADTKSTIQSTNGGANSSLNNLTLQSFGGSNIAMNVASVTGNNTFYAQSDFTTGAPSYLGINVGTISMTGGSIKAFGQNSEVNLVATGDASFSDDSFNPADTSTFIWAQGGGLINISADLLNIDSQTTNSPYNPSWIEATTGGVVNISGSTAVHVNGQNIWTGTNYADRIYATSGGSINFTSPQIIIGQETAIQDFGTASADGTTITFNANPTGSEAVALYGLVDVSSTAGVANSGGILNVNGGGVQIGSTGDVEVDNGHLNINNFDNTLLTAANLGTINTYDGATMIVGGASFTNNGAMNLNGQYELFGMSGLGVNNATLIDFINTGTIGVGGTLVDINGQVDSSGTINVAGGAFNVVGGLTTNEQAGTFSVRFGGQVSTQDFANNGSLTVDGTLLSGLSSAMLQANNFDNSGSTASVSDFHSGQFNTLGDLTNEQGANFYDWGGSSVSVQGNLNNLTGGQFYMYDASIQYGGGPVMDLGGGNLLVTGNLINTDSQLYIGAESAATIGAINNSNTSIGGVEGQLNVDTGGSLEVTSGDYVNAGTGYAQNSGTTTIDQGNLIEQDSSTFQMNSGLLTVSKGNIINSGTSATIIAGGIANVNQGNVISRDSSAFYVQNAGTQLNILNGKFINRDSSTLTLGYGGVINLNSGNFVNRDNATVYLSDPGSKIYLGTGNYIEKSGSGTIVENGGALELGAGNLTVSAGTAYSNGAGSTITVDKGNLSNNDGVVAAIGGGTITVSNGTYSNTNGGSTYIDKGSLVQVTNGDFDQLGNLSSTKVYGTLTANNIVLGSATQGGGTLGGPGTVNGNVNNISGTVNVGDPNIFTINGDYSQGANGTLELNLDGTGGPGVGYDQLVVNGSVTLGGTLDIMLGNGYSPSGTYALLSFTGTLTGSFSTVEETYFNASGLLVTVNLPGNLKFGSNGMSYQAVPEPSSLALLGLAGLGLWRRKRASR